MTKIDLIAQDLVAKIKTVPEFNNRVGLAVGGTDIDPINRDLKRPAAWCVFTGTPVVDGNQIATANTSVLYTFVVKILVDYGTEADLTSIHFPLLENTVNAVKGTLVNGLTLHTWSFDGLAMESLDADRQVWVMNCSVLTSV